MKGFIQLSLMGWVMLILGGIIVGLGIYAKVQTARLESTKAEYAAFVTKVKTIGEEQERKTKAQELADKQRKEKADAENKSSRERIADLSKRLRDARASGRFVPAPAPGSASSGGVTYNRAELEREIQRLDSGVSGLLAEGDKAITDLNTAKTWASSNAPPPRQ